MANLNNRVQTQLTAPGSTAGLALGQYGGGNKFYKVVVASINTNCVLRVEFSSTQAFSAVTAQRPDVTITANGTYILDVKPAGNFARLTFVSETGGTAVTIDATLVEEGA